LDKNQLSSPKAASFEQEAASLKKRSELIEEEIYKFNLEVEKSGEHYAADYSSRQEEVPKLVDKQVQKLIDKFEQENG
jgi:hypothetical protein